MSVRSPSLFAPLVVLLAVAGLPGYSLAADDEPPIFYPPPPDLPRLQFLKKYSSDLDVETENKGFRDFVFGGEEKERHLIEKPYGLALHQGTLYVVDVRGNGWGEFDLTNDKARIVRPSGAAALKKPINITIDADGTRYVTDTGRQQIVVFDANDRYVGAFGSPDQFNPVDVAISGERLYVTDILKHRVVVLDKASGDELFAFGSKGDAPGNFLHPTNLAFAPDGSLYVTDTSNFRLQQFDKEGELVRTVGKVGTGAGHFARPKGLAFDNDGNAYVVDAAFENVQVLAPDGGALMAFGEPGTARDSINLPTAVKIDYDNLEYFEQYVAPGFDLKYLVLVASQFGLNKVVVFGYVEPVD
jgi:DNA-binding beta-propeller fold protein YncE